MIIHICFVMNLEEIKTHASLDVVKEHTQQTLTRVIHKQSSPFLNQSSNLIYEGLCCCLVVKGKSSGSPAIIKGYLSFQLARLPIS